MERNRLRPRRQGDPVISDVLGEQRDKTIIHPKSSRMPDSLPNLKIEHRSLLSLLGTGKIPPVDSVAVGCLSDSILAGTDVSKEEVIHEWYEALPTLSAVTQTSMGRIGTIVLPCFRSQIYNHATVLSGLVVEALELARQIGARTVSLTGLIPSATEYGQSVARRISGRHELPKFTTGHATIAATVALSILRILEESGRDLRLERVGFLGMGSIGKTVLRLMLRCLPHPAEFTLCDIYSTINLLESVQKDLKGELGFKGPIKVFRVTDGMPSEFYNCSLLVGATNVAEVLDLERVKPGTLIVDDRRPQCFKAEDAVRRFLSKGDILFTEGDTLQSPTVITQLKYIPRQALQRLGRPAEAFTRFNPFRIHGCVLSSLLSARYDDLRPTIGFANDRDSWLHYQKLSSLGFQAAGPHCEQFVFQQEQIRNFRARFGHFHGESRISREREKTIAASAKSSSRQNR